MTHDRATPILVMEGIEKSFPGVHALKSAGLSLYSGEVHALMGENGAGKSTLIKTLAGAIRPDAGAIQLDGRVVAIRTPKEAQQLGIAVIYQEFNLVPYLTARENIFLGREGSRFGFFSKSEERRETRALFERLGARIDPEARCRDLSVAGQQMVEIAKALSTGARILVMDEPTAALSAQEVEKLFDVIADLRAHGISVVYVSHRMAEIFRVADRLTVMRDGETIDTRPVSEFTRESLIEVMVGRKLENEFPKQVAEIGEKHLEVVGLRRGDGVRNVSFFVRRGEVLGLAGLVGAGRTEVARLVFGADTPDSGEIKLAGERVEIRSPSDAIRKGICLLTEDRKAQGLVLGLSVRENFGLPNLEQFSDYGVIKASDERNAFARFVTDLRIKVASQEQRARTLSGGNQQKVVLAKWLEANGDVLIFDEPTRGIDVGAKYEIYLLMNRLAAQGKSIVMISSELPEVLGMSDRILVMHEGRISGEITDVANATQEQIMALAVGARPESERGEHGRLD
jgi:ribose transport system ATP-binding protein